MFDALEKHGRKFRKGGKNSTNLRFADDIDALRGRSRTEASDILEQLTQMMAQNRRLFQGLNKPLQLIQS